MVWISLFFLINLNAAELPRFLTKHSKESLRFISYDGRFAYVVKKSGILGLVSNFKSLDFMTEQKDSDFLVKSSDSKKRIIIEHVVNSHSNISLLKNHNISVVDFGNSIARKVGEGRSAKLHLNDEWISYYDIQNKIIYFQNLLTQKKFQITTGKKPNPFFIPDVEMISSRQILYTEENETGHGALISYDLESSKNALVYKTSQNAMKLEICRSENYLALGEFPFEGSSRSSKIQLMSISGMSFQSSFSTLYSNNIDDIGNMICRPESIFWVKTIKTEPKINFKITEAAQIHLNDKKIEIRSDLKQVAQIINMDGRVMIPFRGEFFILEGENNLGVDTLKSKSSKEELEIDL